MSDIVLRFVGAPVYEGRPGWPAKDLTQEELDARGLDAQELLDYRTGNPAKPRLYEAVGEAEKAQQPDPFAEVDVTEAAWALAWEHDIDLTEVVGSGKNGRILKGDVGGLL